MLLLNFLYIFRGTAALTIYALLARRSRIYKVIELFFL